MKAVYREVAGIDSSINFKPPPKSVDGIQGSQSDKMSLKHNILDLRHVFIHLNKIIGAALYHLIKGGPMMYQ
jgi:hypothetical protein